MLYMYANDMSKRYILTFQKKSWVKTYCLVWGKSQQSHPYMDFYESKEVYMQQKEKGKTCDRRVDLQHVKAVQYLCERDNTGNMEYSIEIKFNKGGKSQHFKFEDPTQAHNWHIKLSEAVDIPVLEQPASEGYESGDQEETNEGYDDEDEVVTINNMYGGSGAGIYKNRYRNYLIIYTYYLYSIHVQLKTAVSENLI